MSDLYFPLNRDQAADWIATEKAPSTSDFVVDVFHDIGTNADPIQVIEESRTLPASNVPTRIKLRSVVASRTANRSPEYFATIRRRRAGLIRSAIRQLSVHEGADDIFMHTGTILDAIRELLHALDGVKTEGNARQVLRYLRDSFLDGGWDAYKKATSVTKAVGVASLLADNESVTAKHADTAYDDLVEVGLEPVVLPAMRDEQAEGEANGQSE